MVANRFVASCIAGILLTCASLSAENGPIIPGAKEIFSVRPSPWEDRLLLFALQKEVEGESAAYVSGPLVSVSTKGNSWRSREVRPIAADMDSANIAWAKGSAFVTATRGIFRLRPGVVPQKIYSGKPAGLAVSRDGAFLAFWEFLGKIDTLVVLRASDRRVIRQWKRPYHLKTESSGWDLVFAPDGSAVLARTYDEEDDNHLKSFNIRTGAMTTLLEGCNSIVQNGDRIFVFGGQDDAKGLYEFSGDTPHLLLHVDDEDSLTPTANSNMIVITNAFKKHLIIYDAEQNATREFDGCSDATVLKNGQQLFFRDGNVLLNASECSQ